MKVEMIKNICSQYNIYPSKARGQNFLIDENIVDKIIDSAGLSKSTTVLEVGPGLGILTEKLLTKSDNVVAVEVDKHSVQYLKTKFQSELKNKKLTLIESDALKVDWRKQGLFDFQFKIVANLPYSITSLFFRQFLEFGPKPSEIIVMIQKEVAERMLAKVGKMNLLALSSQFFSEPEILFLVGSGSFWPAPEVESAVIKLKLKTELPEVDIKKMFRLAKMGFASKRKQLKNNLASGLKKNPIAVEDVLNNLNLRSDIRAQDLSVANWVDLVGNI